MIWINARGVIATLIAILILLLAYSPAAQADKLRADSNGHIPVTFTCHPYNNTAGLYWWDRAENGNWQGHIEINYCLLKRLNAGPTDFWRIYQHELAHAHGKDHYEGTPRTNAAYYPSTTLCHC